MDLIISGVTIKILDEFVQLYIFIVKLLLIKLTLIIKNNSKPMYKDRIKNRLQKIKNDDIKTPIYHPSSKAIKNKLSPILQASRRAKIILSKDLSLATSQDITQSKLTYDNRSQSKRKYLKLVSTSVSIPKNTIELSSSNINFSKYTNMSKQISCEDGWKGCQTPIKKLIINNQQTQLNTRTPTSSINTPQYKNQHRIQVSPSPIRLSNSISYKQIKQQNKLQHHGSLSCLLEKSQTNYKHQIISKLEAINLEKGQIQIRIAKKLDQLTSRTSSIIKQQNLQMVELPKKHKVLCLNSSNISKNGKINQQNKSKMLAQPRKPTIFRQNDKPNKKEYLFVEQKTKNLRNMIMSRIFS